MSLSETIREDPELQQVHDEIQSLQAKMMGTTDPNRLSELEEARNELLGSEAYQRFLKAQDGHNHKKDE